MTLAVCSHHSGGSSFGPIQYRLLSPYGSQATNSRLSTMNSQNCSSRNHDKSFGVRVTTAPGMDRTTRTTARRPRKVFSTSNAKVRPSELWSSYTFMSRLTSAATGPTVKRMPQGALLQRLRVGRAVRQQNAHLVAACNREINSFVGATGRLIASAL